MAPTRRLRKPFTTRQTAANHCRSLAKSGESGLSVCNVVIEYGMPYCLRLLQADILPQKLSRRKAMVIFLGSSGVAWINTGTRKSASRNVSAIALSSPKFGRVTIMPSIRSRLRLNKSAQRLDSSRVSTAPYLLSSGVSATTSIPAAFNTCSISSRPLLAR